MLKYILCTAVAALTSLGIAEKTTTATNDTPRTKGISIQEMLVTGPAPLKLHSLAMITQGKAPGGVDESFLPGLKVCSEDPVSLVRSIAARVIGEHLVAGKDAPNPEAVELLVKLAKDESGEVRYNAIYYGLTEIKDMPDKIIELLVDLAIQNRESGLYEKIAVSLKDSKEKVGKILDEKLEHEDSLAIFEIYESLTGKKAPSTEQ